MAQNFVHEGKVLELTAPRTVKSGEGAAVGSIFGIALGDYTSGDTGCPFAVNGVWDLAKDGSGFSQGDNIYWDDSTHEATSTPASHLLIGVAEADAGASDTVVRVKLTEKPFEINVAGAGVTASAAELNVLHSVVAGTARASSGVVLDANKSIDVSQVTTQRSLGGTGVPGAAAVQTEVTKKVTGLGNATATDVLTVTVPNAQHAALIDVDVLGVLGAGGTIGAGESFILSKYQIIVGRTAGVAAVAVVSAAIGGQKGAVAGGDAMTSAVVTVSAISGAVSAPNTFTIKVAITKASGASDNHVAVVSARLLNENAAGITIA